MDASSLSTALFLFFAVCILASGIFTLCFAFVRKNRLTWRGSKPVFWLLMVVVYGTGLVNVLLGVNILLYYIFGLYR